MNAPLLTLSLVVVLCADDHSWLLPIRHPDFLPFGFVSNAHNDSADKCRGSGAPDVAQHRLRMRQANTDGRRTVSR